jgi:putative transposase
LLDSWLHNWLKKADIEDGARPGVTEKETAEVRDAGKRIRLLEQENEILRRAAAFFARELPPKWSSRWSLTKTCDGIPVAVACRGLGFSKQAFYAWRAAPVTERDWSDAHLINAAVDVHRDDPAFGHRFIAGRARRPGFQRRREPGRPALQQPADLVRLRQETRPDLQGRSASPRWPRPAGLHRDGGWSAVAHGHHRAPTDEGKLSLCAIKDVYSNRIVGYSIDSRMKASLAVSALNNAVALRGPAGTVVHPRRSAPGHRLVEFETINSGLKAA